MLSNHIIDHGNKEQGISIRALVQSASQRRWRVGREAMGEIGHDP